MGLQETGRKGSEPFRRLVSQLKGERFGWQGGVGHTVVPKWGGQSTSKVWRGGGRGGRKVALTGGPKEKKGGERKQRFGGPGGKAVGEKKLRNHVL